MAITSFIEICTPGLHFFPLKMIKKILFFFEGIIRYSSNIQVTKINLKQGFFSSSKAPQNVYFLSEILQNKDKIFENGIKHMRVSTVGSINE